MNTHFAERRRLIDEHLARLDAQPAMAAPLREPLSTAIRSAGKRVRGLLTITVGEACGLQPAQTLDAACAFELIHTSSLILDDLPSMDDSDLRRGQPVLHRVYGEDLAILTAVALLNHAYMLVGRNHDSLRPRRWPLYPLIQRVSEAVGWDGAIGGESVDLHSAAESLDFRTLEYIHSRKTGAIFVAAAASGAILANANQRTVAAIEGYAKNLGLAFQITDDILDVTSTPEQLGKDTGKDQSRLTFVKLAGLDGARQLVGDLIETSCDAIGPLGARGKHLVDLAITVRDRVG